MPNPTDDDSRMAADCFNSIGLQPRTGLLDVRVLAEWLSRARVSGEGEVDRLMLSDDWNGNWCLECWGGEFNVIDLNNDNEDVIATGPTAIGAIRAALATIGEKK